ncbi:hypothetical protein RvY_04653 [Ramazzottius varieornatus]|uniref:G-protein coupled receptors family 1 profile domain-containing protein n=1 Tax=Ramazzottius varieornatus TaxID=947166 RepID=A0A1D1USE1_RAMVA|nr:hypothetical protein RvY_04653 [Ramazzottius varieornatus]
MAISDFLVGAICIPCSIVYEYYKYWPLSTASCSFYMYFDYTVTNVSVWTLVIVSFDRLWAAHWPVSYREYNNRLKALIGIVLSWLIVNATILPGFIHTRMTFGWLTEKERSCSWEHDGLPVFASSFPVSVMDGWLPTPIVVTCYVLTLVTIYKRGINITHPEPAAAPTRQVSRNRKRQERQAFWVLTLLVIAQVALWMPWIVYLIRMHLFHYESSELYIDVAYWLGYSLSAVNPVLFNIGNKDIFNSIKKLFGLRVPVSEGSRGSRATGVYVRKCHYQDSSEYRREKHTQAFSEGEDSPEKPDKPDKPEKPEKQPFEA